MKYSVLICAIVLTACGGTLSDEQRKKFKEGMEMEKIVRATDSDILAVALDKGHATYDALKATTFSTNKIDSIEKALNVRINFLVPGKSNALAIEQEMIDAYVNSIALGGANQENLQKVWTGSGMVRHRDELKRPSAKVNSCATMIASVRPPVLCERQTSIL